MSLVGTTLRFSFFREGGTLSSSIVAVGAGVEFSREGASVDVSDFSLSYYDLDLPWGTFSDLGFLIEDINGTLPDITWVGFTSNPGNWNASRITFDADSITIDINGMDSAFTGTQFVLGIGFSPTDITLSANVVAENAKGAVIGTLSNDDFDLTTTTYSLAPNAYFELDGAALKLKDGVSLDYEAQDAIEVTVTATDSEGAEDSVIKEFTIAIVDVREDPKGTRGKDKLFGDAFDNIMNGRRSNDKLIGGEGADTFVLSHGRDRVRDFDVTEDLVDIGRAEGIRNFHDLKAHHLKERDDGLVIFDDRDHSLFLKGLDADDLTGAMILF